MSLPSAEVAADFRDALQDLKMNSRPEISNLTIIAKENTEHAQAISRELENHIRATRPEWKLPALYVLDSIVKNVGTPYTVYLSRNLYKTFMDAYTLVDSQTRKAMEGLLRTWKQAVPESMDTRPVFPVEVTRDIESTLIKFRTVAFQTQQQQARSHRPIQSPLHGRPALAASTIPWRHTPTPPNAQYAPPSTPQSATSQSGHTTFTPPVTYPTPQPADRLGQDLERLISQAKLDFAANPFDTSTQQKLKALLDLQTILKSQQLPPQQLQAIQAEVDRLSSSLPLSQPMPASVAPQPAPQLLAQAPTPSPNLAQLFSQALPAQSTPTPLNQRPTAAAVPALQIPTRISSPSAAPAFPTNLAQLLKQSVAPTATPPPSTPTVALAPAAPPAVPLNLSQLLAQFTAPKSAPPPAPLPVAPPPPAASNGTAWLLEALRSQNLVPGQVAPSTSVVAAITPIPAQLQARPPQHIAHTVQNDVEMTTASIRRSRPQLKFLLYEANPSQCQECGRRFPATEEGRKLKARHHDWHFQVNMRLAEAANRPLQREWYCGEETWIKMRDRAPDIDAFENKPSTTAAQELDGGKDKLPQVPYVLTSTEALGASVQCPVCHDTFKAVWHPEAEDWVWMDAVKRGDKVYHASCLAEMSRDGGSIGTPQPASATLVLGKRKAEVHDLKAP